MSGLAGSVGPAASAAVVAPMLAAIGYRGDTSAQRERPGAALGLRYWAGRPGKAQGLVQEGARTLAVAGTLAPPAASPGEALLERTRGGALRGDDLDGAFAFALWDEDAGSLLLGRDPFGVRSLYYVEHGGTLHFATELKQLLAVPGLPVELDATALHKYLTFSFVPGEAVPVRGVRRLLPGHTLRWSARHGAQVERYFHLVETVDPALTDPREATRAVRRLLGQAVERRLNGEPEVGLFLSGGLDSASVGAGLVQAGARVRAFTLDFGERSVELGQARTVATALGVPLEVTPVGGEAIRDAFWEVVHRLDLPFGDPVTAPQFLLGQRARAAGLTAVFNGEGGDQLFGGWTSKPMVAAELYGGMFEDQDESREETYLRSYHRFYGAEGELYTEAFAAAVGGPGQRRAHLAPYLGDHAEGSFLGRVRLADIHLKDSQNILPRAERMANACGLDVRVPLFDRALAEAAFRLPPELKLRGACEKYVLKRALRGRLPEEIVWRKKFGMSVPITEFALGALAPLLEDLLGEASLRRRGLFRPEFVGPLRAGRDLPGEVRRRRVGERLWTLAMAEAWMRVFLDRRGTP